MKEIIKFQNKEDLLNICFTPDEVKKKFDSIITIMLEDSPVIKKKDFNVISTGDLYFLFDTYDKIFFNNLLNKHIKNISFDLSKRMTKSAGSVRFYPTISGYKLTISLYLLYKSFEKPGERKIYVNGYKCDNRLEALLKIFEHELIHLIEFLNFNKSNCKNKRFKTLALSIFNHHETTHNLITQPEIALNRFGIKIGKIVYFYYKGKIIHGRVQKITKRATVFCEDIHGSYQDKSGKRYKKFLIPLTFLSTTPKDVKKY